MLGQPAPLPQIFADVDRGIAQGELHVQGNDLETLLGRPVTPIAAAIAKAIAAQ